MGRTIHQNRRPRQSARNPSACKHLRRSMMLLIEIARNLPSIISQSGFLTRSESGCGSLRLSHFVSSASLISSAVRCRMKTGLPRHLIMTYKASGDGSCDGMLALTFLPSGIAARSISTFAWASTSAEADIFTRKSEDVSPHSLSVVPTARSMASSMVCTGRQHSFHYLAP